jgi:glycosyltransferase involved in cell wall biosynthesis
MRVLLWHGWLLDGTGSNVYTAKTAEALRAAGHDVIVLSQEPRPQLFRYVDGWGTVDGDGVSGIEPTGYPPADGRLVLLRPDIGSLLPVFVLDEYEGFEAKRFVDLSDEELATYLDRNAAALAAAARWHRPHATIVGHLMPAAEIALRALGPGAYLAKIHGSDLEYAIRPQERYRRLAGPGAAGAKAVAGASSDVLRRAVELVPEAEGKTVVVPPGVEIERWRPIPRRQGLELATTLLGADPGVVRGRSDSVGRAVALALGGHDAEALDSLAATYDQWAPDPGAGERLRALMADKRPVVGYVGKFIPQKGLDLLLCAVALLGPEVRALLVGFGSQREWLEALVIALDRADVRDLRWLTEASDLRVELDEGHVRAAAGLAGRVTFTGRLDHRYAPAVVAAMDVLVVPSVLEEAFGMVAAEAAAAGVLPLVSRHSGLAEVAGALEDAVGRPGLFSFEPGPGATRRIADGVERLLGLPDTDREAMRRDLSSFVAERWTWERTATRLLEAAAGTG